MRTSGSFMPVHYAERLAFAQRTRNVGDLAGTEGGFSGEWASRTPYLAVRTG